MMSVQIYKKILLFRVDFFRNMLTFRPSDIKMAKNIMDGPVLGCFASVFGTVRQEIAPKVVGRSVVALREGWHCVFLGGAPGVEISPLAPLARHSRSALSVIPVLVLFVIPGLPSPSFPARPGISQL